ncbi:MAG: hypothetical protein WC915_01535 [archaeon]
MMNKKIEGRIILLGISLILLVLIIFWPIYFFVFSGIKIISLGINELIFFGFIELILVLILVGFWQVYSRVFHIK